MTEKVKDISVKRGIRLLLFCVFAAAVIICFCTVTVYAENEDETLPPEYSDFIGALDGEVSDKLPNGAFSNDADEIKAAAEELSDPVNVIAALIDALGTGLKNIIPTLAGTLGIVILSALLGAFASNGGGTSRAAEFCIKICTYSALSGMAIKCAESLSVYFERLFGAVASFLPLSGVLFAMGGNLGAAVSGSASLGVTLAICEFFCTKTVIPVFCICLCMSMLSVFEGQGASAGGAVGATIRKWYTTSLAFVMMILTFSLSSSTLLAVKADNMAMRGVKFAVSNFVPVSGGTVSSTLGTLASSVELLRSSIGTIGISVIILMLLPTVIELALLRSVFAVGSFCASMLGCGGESRLLSELDSLYGYLEGVALLSASIFIIAFGIFMSVATPFS